MKGDIHEHLFLDRAQLAETLASSVSVQLQEAVDAKGSATLAVSGGSTPHLFFERLRCKAIAWKKINVTLCDERWVDESHTDSNAKLVKELLLQDAAAEATFIPLYSGEATAAEAEEACSKRVDALLPYDVVILGMGSDAHTASLFPENARLDEGMTTSKSCIAITPATAPHERMSLTLDALLRSRNLYLHFEGKAKRDVYEMALEAEEYTAMPIRAILHQTRKPVELYCTQE